MIFRPNYSLSQQMQKFTLTSNQWKSAKRHTDTIAQKRLTQPVTLPQS